jgi:hypothetical protein
MAPDLLASVPVGWPALVNTGVMELARSLTYVLPGIRRGAFRGAAPDSTRDLDWDCQFGAAGSCGTEGVDHRPH